MSQRRIKYPREKKVITHKKIHGIFIVTRKYSQLERSGIMEIVTGDRNCGFTCVLHITYFRRQISDNVEPPQRSITMIRLTTYERRRNIPVQGNGISILLQQEWRYH